MSWKVVVSFVGAAGGAAIPSWLWLGNEVATALFLLVPFGGWLIGYLARMKSISLASAAQANSEAGVRARLLALYAVVLAAAAPVVLVSVSSHQVAGVVVVLLEVRAFHASWRGSQAGAEARLTPIRDQLTLLNDIAKMLSEWMRDGSRLVPRVRGSHAVTPAMLLLVSLGVLGGGSYALTPSESKEARSGVSKPDETQPSSSGAETTATSSSTSTTVESDPPAPTSTTVGPEPTAEEVCGRDPFGEVEKMLRGEAGKQLSEAYRSFGALLAGCPLVRLIDEGAQRFLMSTRLPDQPDKHGLLIYGSGRAAVLLPTAFDVLSDSVDLDQVAWATGRLSAGSTDLHVVGLTSGGCGMLLRAEPSAPYTWLPAPVTAMLLEELQESEIPSSATMTKEDTGSRFLVQLRDLRDHPTRSVTVVLDAAGQVQGQERRPGGGCEDLPRLEESLRVRASVDGN